MQKIIIPISLFLIVLIPTLYIFYLEFFAIPEILNKEYGQLATVIHVLGTLFLMLVSMSLGAWLSQRTIFKVQETLVTPHLNHIINAIEKVVVGQWAIDASVQKNVFTTGARLGFNIRNEAIEPDEMRILEGIERMSLPEPKQISGQDNNVISEMDRYMEERKLRLSA